MCATRRRRRCGVAMRRVKIVNYSVPCVFELESGSLSGCRAERSGVLSSTSLSGNSVTASVTLTAAYELADIVRLVHRACFSDGGEM
jgi:hypothetical protein